MTASTILTAFPRDVIGKASHRLAHENRIPAVLYGPGRETVSLSVDRHDFELLMSHHAAGSMIVEMEIAGDKKPINAMIREMQTSPVKGNIVHVDFMVIQMDVAVKALVALHFVNDPVGVKAGGVLTTNIHEINVEAKPGDLPESIDVDVAGLDINDALHVKDIVAPKGVTILDEADDVLVSVQPPRVEVEEEVVAAEEAEPELIGGKPEAE
jgi:large subunit ribosomal protein L25